MRLFTSRRHIRETLTLVNDDAGTSGRPEADDLGPTDAEDGRIHICLMNEYGGGLPLWPENIDTEIDDLVLSGSLIADLETFVTRWNAAIPPEVSDDRWDGVPIMQSLVAARYALGQLLHPARERAAEAESEEMRRIGEDLRIRLERELGPGYRVTYVHT